MLRNWLKMCVLYQHSILWNTFILQFLMVCVCVSTETTEGILSLDLEGTTIMSHLSWVLRPDPDPVERGVKALLCAEPSMQPQHCCRNFNILTYLNNNFKIVLLIFYGLWLHKLEICLKWGMGVLLVLESKEHNLDWMGEAPGWGEMKEARPSETEDEKICEESSGSG